MPSPTSTADARFAAKVRIISAIILVSTMVFVSIAVVLIPVFIPDYAVEPGALVAVFGALTPSSIAFAGAVRLK